MTTTTKLTIIAAAMLLATTAHAAGTAINETGEMPDASAILDARSENKGFLPPRMTAAQRTAIPAPATGLQVYQTDGTAGMYVYNGTAWNLIGNATGTVSTANGGTGSTDGSITGTSALTFAAGGTNQNVTLTPTGSGYTLLGGNVGIGTTTPNNKLQIGSTTYSVNSLAMGNGTQNFAIDISARTIPTFFSDNNFSFMASGGGNGNVGIGTASPGTKLHVDNGALYVHGIDNTANNYTLLLRNQNTDNMMVVYNDGTTYMKGNVGIGTSTPASKLHIAGADMNNALLFENTSANPGRNYILFKTQGTEQGYIGLGGGASNHMSIAAYGASNNLFLETGSLVRMTILPTGIVGIGTTTPAYKLQIQDATSPAIALQYSTNSDYPYLLSNSTNDLIIGSAGSGSHAVFKSTGNVGIGTTTPGSKLHVESSVSNHYAAVIRNYNNTSSGYGLQVVAGSGNADYGAYLIDFFDATGTTRLGSIAQSGSNTVLYNTSSDRRLKNNIVNTHFGISDLMKIQVRDYEYKADSSKTLTTGFIAQELYEIFPNAVTKSANAEEMWSVDYGKVTPLLVKGMQDLKAENDGLKARLDKLEKALGL